MRDIRTTAIMVDPADPSDQIRAYFSIKHLVPEHTYTVKCLKFKYACGNKSDNCHVKAMTSSTTFAYYYTLLYLDPLLAIQVVHVFFILPFFLLFYFLSYSTRFNTTWLISDTIPKSNSKSRPLSWALMKTSMPPFNHIRETQNPNSLSEQPKYLKSSNCFLTMTMLEQSKRAFSMRMSTHNLLKYLIILLELKQRD